MAPKITPEIRKSLRIALSGDNQIFSVAQLKRAFPSQASAIGAKNVALLNTGSHALGWMIDSDRHEILLLSPHPGEPQIPSFTSVMIVAPDMVPQRESASPAPASPPPAYTPPIRGVISRSSGDTFATELLRYFLRPWMNNESEAKVFRDVFIFS